MGRLAGLPGRAPVVVDVEEEPVHDPLDVDPRG
jgi:hypothetical protein